MKDEKERNENIKMISFEDENSEDNGDSYTINSPDAGIYLKEVGIYIFGRPKNWRSSFEDHLELIQILREKKINKVYIPNVSTFSGCLALAKDFSKKSNIDGIEIMNGCISEGLILPFSSAVFLTTADCYTVTCHNHIDKTLIVFHAGLGSVIDKMKIIIGVSSRPHESIIDDLMKYVKNPDQYDIFINCGISSLSFRYDIRNPLYGETNMKILTYLLENYKEAVPHGLKYGGVSIKNILIEQLLNYGFLRDKIRDDVIDTGTDSRFWSHYRFSLVGREKECGRNGILVLNS